MIIKNAVLISMNGVYREKTDLVIRGGKIAGVCSHTDGACGEPVLDAMDSVVTPGFVEADCLAGTRSQIFRRENHDADDAEAINPGLRALDTLDFSDEAFAMARRGGVTTVVSSPGRAALIGGTCAAVKTGGEGYEARVLKAESAYQFSLTSEPRKRFGGRGVSPMTRMGSTAMIRNALSQARQYREERREKNGMPFRLDLAALSRVFDGMPVKIAANSRQDIMTAVRIGEEFGLRYVVCGAYDALWACENLEREDIPFLVGPLYGRGKSKEENRRLDLAGTLEKRGVSFGVTCGHPAMNLELFACQLSLLTKAGMSEKEALRAATILPAKLLGLDDRIGSIEPGKDADLVIWNGEPLDFYGSVRTMVINGKVTEV